MSALQFMRAARAILVAQEGSRRFQIWQRFDNYRPGANWGAAVFSTSEFGAKRKTEDRYFATQAEAIEWLEQQRRELCP